MSNTGFPSHAGLIAFEEHEESWGSAVTRLPFKRVVLASGVACLALAPAHGGSGWADVAAGLAMYAIPLVWWIIVARRRSYSAHDLMGENLRWKHAGLVFLTIGAILGVRFGALALLQTFDLLPKYWRGAESEAAGVALTLSNLLITAALGPCTEEILFRGLIFRRLLERARPLPAALCSSVLFGLVHFDVVGAALFGLAMAVLYVQTRSLWVPIAAHVLNNLVIGLRTWFGVHVPVSWVVIAVGIACLPWLAWFLRRGLRQVQSLPQSFAS